LFYCFVCFDDAKVLTFSLGTQMSASYLEVSNTDNKAFKEYLFYIV